MPEHLDVAVVGAGPYGLSVGATLIGAGRNVRVFGQPMQMWRNMLDGMMLKSYGSASNLTAPGNAYPLKAYAREFNVPYQDFAHDVTLDNFARYGLEFQKRYVPNLETTDVERLRRRDDRYHLATGDGREFTADRVVLAVGVGHFAHFPDVFDAVPRTKVTHSITHSSMSKFAGQDVTVIGAGSSAVEAAVALIKAGARARLLVRGDHIPFPDRAPGKRSLFYKISRPPTGLESGWSGVLLQYFPQSFRLLPKRFRADFVRTYLGPKPVWRLKQAVEAAEILLDTRIVSAQADDSGITLSLERDGQPQRVKTDHVILGTGFVPDLDRLQFIDAELRAEVDTFEGWPLLNGHFESSASGLYFVGNAAALTYGPLMRFVVGTKFAATTIAKAIG